jgi:hypothetical protein
MVSIKNHTAIVTGNVSDPSVNNTNVGKMADELAEFEMIVSYKVTTDDLQAINASLTNLKTISANIAELNAAYAEIEELEATFAKLDYVNVKDVEALNASIDHLEATFGEFTGVSTEDLEAINAEITSLRGHTADFTYVSADVLHALKATIDNLEANKLSAEQADLKYANIDFSNIGKAAMEYFYANSGLIENVVVGDGSITGLLVGVTIKGDLIEGETIVADKLVIRGDDGLYYKLNTDGETIEAEQTEYNSINGQIITAKSITATKINVDDLVAFDATIGGFNITSDAIYSGVKESIDNTASGTYLDKEGQFSLGDETNYLRYYKTEDGTYRLEISADSILFGANTKSALDDIKALTDRVKIGTHTDPDTGDTSPSIELSEGDSDFKHVITNKSSDIMDGENVVTQMDTDGIKTENLEVRGEHRQGGWAWVTHGKGNLGLMWKGATD